MGDRIQKNVFFCVANKHLQNAMLAIQKTVMQLFLSLCDKIILIDDK
ncbi:MAG: hypothetical protein DELT_00599 [Desulfovibrio sp.]